MSAAMRVVRVGARLLARRAARQPPDSVGARSVVARAERLLRVRAGVDATCESVAGVPVLRLTSGGAARGTVVHLHGGAHIAGSPRTALALQRVVAKGGPDVVSVDYRLAPENRSRRGLTTRWRCTPSWWQRSTRDGSCLRESPREAD